MKKVFQSLLFVFTFTFISCNEKLIEEGEPYADFTVTGTVKSLSGNPLPNIVVTTTSYLMEGYAAEASTTVTIEQGHYELKPYVPYSNYIVISVEDPTGQYLSDSYRIDRSVINKELEGKNGYYLGMGSLSSIDFALKMK